jgi:predicted ATPase/signal transduction histidine kinase
MIDLHGYTFETLRQDDELVVARCTRDGVSSSFLVLSPASAGPAPETLARLERQHTLRDVLESSWAARPVEFVRHHGQPALLLENPGGELLERLCGEPWRPRRFLCASIGLAFALGRAHRRGLIHKDVKPANALVDDSGRAWLMGFGISSFLSREWQAPKPLEVIAGTFAYMAPEQTGRMNRSIDTRSDLYSLGVTFYEMLVGAKPFVAVNPMEWVHCHIARVPPSPHARLADIPQQVSAIVMKLLAKPAEERYQTAAGLEADLRRCLTEWEFSGRIDPFPLGEQDVSDRLLVPEKLYGRTREVDTLLEAFARVVRDSSTELVLVSGYSGVGKSSVVNELHQALIEPRGLFAAGKFDQYKRDIPYATIAQAFQGLTRQLLSKSDAELARWRDALRAALGPNGQLMVNLIPELEHIVGPQPPVSELPSRDALSRFMLVFRRLLGVFARREHPLILLLDDLQWLDSATLDLLEHLVTHPEVRHLLLIGAYRDNEVSAAHPLRRILRTIRHAGGRVREIALEPLEPENVVRLVTDTLRCSPTTARPLADLVHEKTGGNPFFAIQFLTALADDALLAFDHGKRAWTWDLTGIRARGYTENVVHLIASKLQRLPEATQAALGQLACLGNVAEIGTLRTVCREADDKIHADLWEAVRAGIVVRTESAYVFIHDRAREAAYTSIPETDRSAAHLRIGRTLVAGASPEALGETIFDVVNHLNRSAHLIATAEERSRVAELNLEAGKRAKVSTAYAAALAYFVTGAELLGEEGWERNGALMCVLALQRAECEYLTGDTLAAERRLDGLVERTHDLIDSAAIACLRIELYTTLDRADRAIEVALELLARAGMPVPPRPSDDDVAREHANVRWRLGERSIEQLADLPAMTDRACSAILDVLAAAHAPANFTDGNLLALLIARIVNLSIEHGNSDASPLGYVYLGMILQSRFGDYDAGFRFGKLGADLVENAGLARFKSHAYLNFGNAINPWTRHVRTSLDVLRSALSSAQEAGQLTFAAYSYAQLVCAHLTAGDPLSTVDQLAEEGLRFAQQTGFGTGADLILGHLGLVRALAGRTPELSSFDHRDFEEKRFEDHIASNPRLAMSACWYWIRKLQARFLAGDMQAAIAAAAQAERLLWTSPGFLVVADYHFYAALALASCDCEPADEAPLVTRLESHRRQIEVWAGASPANFRNRQLLIAAEIARIEGRELEAERLYEEAIRSAHEHGFIQNEALANELAGCFHAKRGFETIAAAYLHSARSWYILWGATAKARQIDERHADLRGQPAEPAPGAMFGVPPEYFDVGAMFQASQALSSEIVLDRLIETLMRITIEHAGAERGLLVLLRHGEPRLAAEASTREDRVEVVREERTVARRDLPEAALHYVLRSHTSVLVDDAMSDDGPFLDDDYLRLRTPRSVLCMPLIKQATLVGVLYLENGVAPQAFTRRRIAVLEFLASQAAISLENAYLYADLQRSEAFLADSQRMSRTGSWSWNVRTGEAAWSAEHYRILGRDPVSKVLPSMHLFMDTVHPDDRAFVEEQLAQVVRERSELAIDYRVLLADGSVRFLHSVGRPIPDGFGEIRDYAGITLDVTERKRSEDALREAQAELALVSRVTTMGELAASIAHEVSQPLTAIIANAESMLLRLEQDAVDHARLRRIAERIVRDGHQAGDVVRSIRAMLRRAPREIASLDVDAVVYEVLAVLSGELRSQQISLEMALCGSLPPILGDRVQLQQVLLNLVKNGIEALSDVYTRPRKLAVKTVRETADAVLVCVEDSGRGFDPADAERIFEAFYSTKPDGMGMGLSICRSIVESHGGRLWAASRLPYGSAFQFTLQTSRLTDHRNM